MKDHALQIKELINDHPDVPTLTPQEKHTFDSSASCCICSCNFTIFDLRVIHHSHATVKFIGSAHQSCNINCKCADFIHDFFIRFRDSYRFLSSSLRNLVISFPNTKLTHTLRAFPNPVEFSCAKEKN